MLKPVKPAILLLIAFIQASCATFNPVTETYETKEREIRQKKISEKINKYFSSHSFFALQKPKTGAFIFLNSPDQWKAPEEIKKNLISLKNRGIESIIVPVFKNSVPLWSKGTTRAEFLDNPFSLVSLARNSNELPRDFYSEILQVSKNLNITLIPWFVGPPKIHPKNFRGEPSWIYKKLKNNALPNTQQSSIAIKNKRCPELIEIVPNKEFELLELNPKSKEVEGFFSQLILEFTNIYQPNQILLSNEMQWPELISKLKTRYGTNVSILFTPSQWNENSHNSLAINPFITVSPRSEKRFLDDMEIIATHIEKKSLTRFNFVFSAEFSDFERQKIEAQNSVRIDECQSMVPLSLGQQWSLSSPFFLNRNNKPNALALETYFWIQSFELMEEQKITSVFEIKSID